MSGKIEISRKLAERLLNFTCNEEYDELRALLAAPVVERQEPIYQVRSHGSCCWEDISGESLYVCAAQPEEYEIRKLYTSPPAPVAVPDGWKIVPIIATLEMKNAGWSECDRQGVDPESIEMQTIWTAMHLASPDCLDKLKELNQ